MRQPFVSIPPISDNDTKTVITITIPTDGDQYGMVVDGGYLWPKISIMTYTDINNIDVNYKEWLGSLEFYKDDLDILSNRLTEVARKNTGSEALKGVEHFQNQFDIQRQHISDLQHRIKSSLRICAEDVKHHAGKVSTAAADSVKSIEQDISGFEKNIKELRHEYNSFLVKWM